MTSGVFDILQGTKPDQNKMYVNFKPVRYRYVMTYLHDEVEKGSTPAGDVLHQAGELMAILPMTSVNYGVGMYSGTNMSGSVALPEMKLDLMPHTPLYDYERIPHPDVSGIPVGAMFECGNRAIYVMRNNEVVWGGILWSRDYSSDSPQLQITALSWEGYIYYRLLRLTISFPAPVNMYTIWYAVLKAAFMDFDWMDPNDGRKNYDDYTITTEESTNEDITGAAAAEGTDDGTDDDGTIQKHKWKPVSDTDRHCSVCGKVRNKPFHTNAAGHGNGGPGKKPGPHWVPGKPKTHKSKENGPKKPTKGGKTAYDNQGRPLIPSEAPSTAATADPAADTEQIVHMKWTGINGDQYANMPCINYREQWPYNVPDIELPPKDLKLYYDPENRGGLVGEMTAQQTWRGYDMDVIGDALQQWADTETVASYGGGQRFEYRVLCWYDEAHQRFRQRYVCGEMTYPAGQDPNEPMPNGILRPSLGSNTKAMGYSVDNPIVFDFPGSIASWSLSESMEEAATRVLVTDEGEEAAKHVGYAWDQELLNVPPNDGSQGWLLYDKTVTYGTTSPTKLKQRAEALVLLYKVPTAAQLQDLSDAPRARTRKRTSLRSTSLTVSLYAEPSRPLPDFKLGDWAAFAIADPFYGGTMYLVRRIIGYTVTVVPEQESDYSHEQIELELTDDTQIALG